MTLAQENRVMMRKLLTIAAMMLAFCFALAPLYQKICEVTGIANGRVVEGSTQPFEVDRSRLVTVEFVASNNGSLNWRFEPLQRSIRVNPGQTAHIDYRVTNTMGRAVVAQAVASYGPETAGQYFKKSECFCFKQQKFEADEVRTMPVVFQLSPELPKDVNTVTLSYTFFDVAQDGRPKG